MQKFLNEEREYYSRKLRKHPFILSIVILYITSGICLFTISLTCNKSFLCTNDQIAYMLIFGIIMCLMTLIFIIIPVSISVLLNCIYTEKIVIKNPIINRKFRSPLTSKGPVLKITRTK